MSQPAEVIRNEYDGSKPIEGSRWKHFRRPVVVEILGYSRREGLPEPNGDIFVSYREAEVTPECVNKNAFLCSTPWTRPYREFFDVMRVPGSPRLVRRFTWLRDVQHEVLRRGYTAWDIRQLPRNRRLNEGEVPRYIFEAIVWDEEAKAPRLAVGEKNLLDTADGFLVAPPDNDRDVIFVPRLDFDRRFAAASGKDITAARENP